MEKGCDTCVHSYIIGFEGPCGPCHGHVTEYSGWLPDNATLSANALPLEDDKQAPTCAKSDGSTASYYELPEGAKELQDIIAYLNCNAQLGEIGRAWMRYGRCPHSERERDLKKIIFYAQAELDRLGKYGPE